MTRVSFIMAVMIIIISIMLPVPSCKSRLPENPSACTGKEKKADGIKSMQKCKIEDMLRKLERNQKSAISENNPHDDIRIPPVKFEYFCPVCHEKIVYEAEEGASLRDIEEIKRIFSEQIKPKSKLLLSLDESSLCKKCNPKFKNEKRGVFLVVEYVDGTVNKERLLGLDDILMIREFIKGKQTYESHPGVQESLSSRTNTSRLRQLLGLTVKNN